MSGYEEEPGGGQAVWVALTTAPISMDRAAGWVTRPDCGAVVVFAGTVRDHAEGRPGVDELEYEAYEAQVEPRLRRIADQAREKWDGIGRVVIWHRIGTLVVGESSVIVAVSSGHRGDAFEAARFCIDSVKTSVPIWKRERWAGGEDWGLDAHDVAEVGDRSGATR
ncbi:MAG: molybdenum cofactor biosynthesis protein MoaE [Actinomycetota bacterium]|nr:molybdenum cofactor biosynthesis protein MoaE [Actinomycetota bacterium]